MSAVSRTLRAPRASRVRLASAAFAVSLALGAGSAIAVDAGTRADPAAVAGGQLSAVTIDRLLEVSRVHPQTARSMARLREGVRQGLAAQVFEGRLERKRLPRIERLVDRAYGDDVLRAPIRDAVARALQPGDAAILLTHLHSPLGQRALDAEDAHAMDDGGAAFARFTSTFPSHTEYAERLSRAIEMERVLGFAEVVSGLGLDLQRAMLGGLAFSMPDEARSEIDTLLIELDRQRAPLAEQMRLPMTHYLAFMYEDLSLEEQDALNAFVARPASRRFSEALVLGMSEGMQRASIAFGDGLGRSLTIASVDGEI